MNSQIQPFPLVCNTWGEEELNAAMEVLKSGYYTMGARVKEFEKQFANHFGMKHAIMVNSGSSANLIGVAALCFKKDLPLQRGDEVIVPAISWATTYYPLSQYGLKLRFVDVGLESLNIDVTQLEAAITPRTKMIVAVSILGNPAALDQIRAICDKHSLYLFEDNCESMGASVVGQYTGTFGEINTFSTFFSHHISTMEGGMILTNDDELSELCRCLRAHGWTRDIPKDSLLYRSREDDFYEAYRFILPGYNVRPLEISAAAGIEQLKKLEKMVVIRRDNATFFQDLFRNEPAFIIQRENGRSSWFSFTLILRPEWSARREQILKKLKENKVEYRIITGGNMLRHDVMKHLDHSIYGEMLNANIAHDRGFFVGNFPTDIRPQIERLYGVLKEATR